MGQQEIINFLKEHVMEEFTTREISELIDIGFSSVTKTMRRLLKDPFEEISKRELTFIEKRNKYGATVNTKVFVYWITN